MEENIRMEIRIRIYISIAISIVQITRAIVDKLMKKLKPVKNVS